MRWWSPASIERHWGTVRWTTARAGIITGMPLHLVAPIATLVAVLVMAAPAWAGTVQIQGRRPCVECDSSVE
jgi:hypothetical protein